jgi:hypothetical protein
MVDTSRTRITQEEVNVAFESLRDAFGRVSVFEKQPKGTFTITQASEYLKVSLSSAKRRIDEKIKRGKMECVGVMIARSGYGGRERLYRNK